MLKGSVPGSETTIEDKVGAGAFWQKRVERIGGTLWKNTESRRTRMIFFKAAFVDAIKCDSNE